MIGANHAVTLCACVRVCVSVLHAGSAAAFWPLSPTAGALMLPTLVWVTIAAQLNREIVALNTAPATGAAKPAAAAASKK